MRISSQKLACEDQLNALNMLPISNVIVAKRSIGTNGLNWILIDVYKLGIGHSLISTELGHITTNGSEKYDASHPNSTWMNSVSNNLNLILTGNFLPSRRRNLKGVSIICGLVVSIRKHQTLIETICLKKKKIPFNRLPIPNSTHILRIHRIIILIYIVREQ